MLSAFKLDNRRLSRLELDDSDDLYVIAVG